MYHVCIISVTLSTTMKTQKYFNKTAKISKQMSQKVRSTKIVWVSQH